MAQADFLALGFVVGVRQQDVVAQFVGALLDGKDDARVNLVGGGGDDQAEEFGGFGAQPLGAGVGHVAHLLRQQFDALFGGAGNVGLVPQRFGDRHHRDTR